MRVRKGQRICDHCGTVIPGLWNHGVITILDRDRCRKAVLDLCETCMGQVEVWARLDRIWPTKEDTEGGVQ